MIPPFPQTSTEPQPHEEHAEQPQEDNHQEDSAHHENTNIETEEDLETADNQVLHWF